ncbi:tRNA-uridine aminocarboxypropyltransferase [Aestuariibacter sp. A3R04]|uniref:tRNA-uridine aminocarboxypropyltransferase n=1 Tax=Aestuariibacter sp. A3R04 TaxID=2841571 RepID=UPI001C092D9D|nr:DTW domain-containing protein [Aestuariibacter sp. A3R04]MBU3023792.1 DTW domain-containing protein [Aestuariibacter sp. A3R04]
MALRLRELAKSTRPFVTRGSRVVRCEGCLLPENTCICAARPTPVAKSAFVFLMAKGECYKPTNTGRLIADVAEENYAFSWSRTEPEASLLALLQNPVYAPIIIFPHDNTPAERQIHEVPEDESKIPLFIMLDGTWREAGRMFRKSAYLQTFPVLGIQPEVASDYALREAAHAHQLCTAEVGVEVLKLAGEDVAAEQLRSYFEHFRHQYLMGKPHSKARHPE